MADEEGLCMKMLGPFTEEFYCLDCLAEKMKVPKTALENIIVKFRKRGCTLFTPWRDDEKNG